MRAEHLMRLHWTEVVNGLVVTEQSPKHSVPQTTIRKTTLPLIFNSFILFTHLHPGPFPPSVLPSLPPSSAQKPTQSAGIHLVSCSMSKPIVQLRELFQYIAGGQWTSHLCAFATELSPPPHIHVVSSPAPTYSVPPGQGAIRIPASPLLSGPHGPIELGHPVAAAAAVTQCGVKCRLASQCAQHGWYYDEASSSANKITQQRGFFKLHFLANIQLC